LSGNPTWCGVFMSIPGVSDD